MSDKPNITRLRTVQYMARKWFAIDHGFCLSHPSIPKCPVVCRFVCGFDGFRNGVRRVLLGGRAAFAYSSSHSCNYW